MGKNRKIIPLFAGGIFIIIIWLLACTAPCKKNELINLGIFIATVAIAVVAYIQLESLREQANADFILRFNRDFFGNKINQKIITSIEENKKILEENQGEYTYYQIDDFLGYYELMAQFEKKGFLDFEMIDEMFGHYISLAWKNPEIKKYINELRIETKDPRYYKPFELLAIRIIESEQIVRKSK